MSLVSKIDGLASGPHGSEQVGEKRARFVRLYATETLAKGDAVAFDLSVETNGEALYVKKAKSDAADAADTIALRQAIGICGEAFTLSGTNYEPVSVQVGGLCDFAKILDTNDNPGTLLQSSTTGGQLTEASVSGNAEDVFILPVGILVVEGDAATANSTVYLMNPMNL